MKKRTKKKMLSVLLAMALMAVSIGGCGSTPIDADNVVESTEETAENSTESTVETNNGTTTEAEIKDGAVAGSDNPAEPTVSPSAEPSSTEKPEPTAEPTASPEPTATPKPTEPPHTHDYKVESTVEATCATEGNVVKVCACGEKQTEIIPATGDHSWVEEMEVVTIPSTGHVEETQVQVGTTRRTEYECSYCNARFDTAAGVVDHCVATGDIDHAFARTIAYDYDEPVYETQSTWVIDTPESTSTVGTGRFTCSTCGATK